MPDTTLDPKAIARAVAIETAEDESEVGDFVGGIALDDGVTDFRFVSEVRGYEGWQWSVTLYHDEELDRWTVNESTLVPTDDALLPPKWVPWKDRLEPTDLSVTDAIGTDPDDPRMEPGMDDEAMQTVVDAAEASADAADGEDVADSAGTDAGETGDPAGDDAAPTSSPEDVAEAVTEFELSRRHVLSPLGRSQTAKRWYEGPHGPKALSTKTAGGLACESCGFFIPLKGELNLMFGVCANKWSPDDGRVVSLDHGCGEHSEIEPPAPSKLWVQSKPAFDDLHIDVVAQKPREEHGEIELLERLGEGNRIAGIDVDDEPDDDADAEATPEDIDAQTVPDDEADERDDAERDESADAPEVEETVDVSDVVETPRPDADDETDDDDIDADDADDAADADAEPVPTADADVADDDAQSDDGAPDEGTAPERPADSAPTDGPAEDAETAA